MPRTKAAKLTAKEKEQFFINLYVKHGAVEQKLAYCEKRAALKSGTGRKILKKKSVQEQIKTRMEPVRLEQMKQSMITEAVAKAKVATQEELKSHVLSVQRMKIDLEVLDHELMTMAVGLDMNMFPKEKLDAIKAAYVVFGTLESGNTRRLIPPEHLAKNDGQGTYTALFNRLALNPQPAAPEASQTPPDGIFDLIPPEKPPAVRPPMPVVGESITEPVAKSHSRVITVEVG